MQKDLSTFVQNYDSQVHFFPAASFFLSRQEKALSWFYSLPQFRLTSKISACYRDSSGLWAVFSTINFYTFQFLRWVNFYAIINMTFCKALGARVKCQLNFLTNNIGCFKTVRIKKKSNVCIFDLYAMGRYFRIFCQG